MELHLSERRQGLVPERGKPNTISVMPEANHVDRTEGVFVLVGTSKGLFIYARDPASDEPWQVGGPYLAGREIYAAMLDTRAGRRRLWVSAGSAHWGPGLAWSDDLGRTFTTPERAPIRFPEDTGLALTRVWQFLAPGDEPDLLYAGVEPAALFISRDAGATWELCRGLHDHPHRPDWQPGGGGLCLHTIVRNGGRLYCGISTAGVYRSDDGGATWQARNVGIRADFLAPGNQFPEFGQCVHKLVADPHRPDRLYLQHHGGVYRSDDAGDSWHAIGADLPSDFGFPIAVHPDDGDSLFVLPLEADSFRVTPEARLRVFRSRDGGRSFAALTEGLPQTEAYECVLRDGLTSGPPGLYFGTRSGKVFGARDFDRFELLAGGLPPVLSVKTAVL